jgi:hypothetical protein
VREKIRIPGNFVRAGDYEQNIFDVGQILSRATNHFIGNIQANHASIGHALGQQAHEPTGAAANIQDIVLGADLHAVKHGQRDREMVILHLLAAAGFGPAIEFFAE